VGINKNQKGNPRALSHLPSVDTIHGFLDTFASLLVMVGIWLSKKRSEASDGKGAFLCLFECRD
jgi:hypothetical protein